MTYATIHIFSTICTFMFPRLCQTLKCSTGEGACRVSGATSGFKSSGGAPSKSLSIRCFSDWCSMTSCACITRCICTSCLWLAQPTALHRLTYKYPPLPNETRSSEFKLCTTWIWDLVPRLKACKHFSSTETWPPFPTFAAKSWTWSCLTGLSCICDVANVLEAPSNAFIPSAGHWSSCDFKISCQVHLDGNVLLGPDFRDGRWKS